MQPSAFPVRHNVQASHFEIGEGDALSFAEYQEKAGLIVFTHTYVPPQMCGKNVAEQLVRSGLGWARERGVKVVPQCSYVARFIQHHPEYGDLLASDAKA